MNYKKIIKNRSNREKLLRFLSFVPDELMIKIQYWIKMGYPLNLNNPKRFTEKLQWYKLYYRDPLMKQCADKYEVRDYVKSCGLENILIDDCGVYNDFEDINWENLPEKFVLKDTLGCGGNGVILCTDKSVLDMQSIKNRLMEWTRISTKTKHSGREWVYDGRKHRIYIENYLATKKEEGGLIDYKFFCFYGKPEYLYVIADREIGKKAGLGIYTPDFEKLDVLRADEAPLKRNITKPSNYRELIKCVEILSKPFPESRIDLYDVDGNIYFGEITFFDGSGYMTFVPDEFDYEFGAKFKLPSKMGENK